MCVKLGEYFVSLQVLFYNQLINILVSSSQNSKIQEGRITRKWYRKFFVTKAENENVTSPSNSGLKIIWNILVLKTKDILSSTSKKCCILILIFIFPKYKEQKLNLLFPQQANGCLVYISALWERLTAWLLEVTIQQKQPTSTKTTKQINN